jgi:hypothetical protein
MREGIIGDSLLDDCLFDHPPCLSDDGRRSFGHPALLSDEGRFIIRGTYFDEHLFHHPLLRDDGMHIIGGTYFMAKWIGEQPIPRKWRHDVEL